MKKNIVTIFDNYTHDYLEEARECLIEQASWDNISFDFNEEAVKKIKDGWYANVTVEDGKPKFEDSVKS